MQQGRLGGSVKCPTLDFGLGYEVLTTAIRQEKKKEHPNW